MRQCKLAVGRASGYLRWHLEEMPALVVVTRRGHAHGVLNIMFCAKSGMPTCFYTILHYVFQTIETPCTLTSHIRKRSISGSTQLSSVRDGQITYSCPCRVTSAHTPISPLTMAMARSPRSSSTPSTGMLRAAFPRNRSEAFTRTGGAYSCGSFSIPGQGTLVVRLITGAYKWYCILHFPGASVTSGASSPGTIC